MLNVLHVSEIDEIFRTALDFTLKSLDLTLKLW